MKELGEFINAMTVRLAQGLGLKASDQQQLVQWKQKLEQAKADNVDALDQLKEEIARIEQRIRQKKLKYDQAHGLTQKMIGREIEQVFRELDRKEKQAEITLSGIEANALALDKVGELERAMERGVTEGQLDAIAVQLEGTLGEVMQADNALKDLEQVGYKAPEEAAVDVEKRMGELEGVKQGEKGLSAGTLSRLKELEKESEG